MALYDDLDTKQRTDQIDGWSSGIKLLQSQLALKKAVSAPRRDIPKKTILAPVIDLKSKKEIDSDDIFKQSDISKKSQTTISSTLLPSANVLSEYDWDVVDEYDPLWPNEYDKLVKDKRDKERDKGRDRDDRKREDRDNKRRSNVRFIEVSPPTKFPGFSSRPAENSDEEDNYNKSPPVTNQARTLIGAAIAPPPSLQTVPQITENILKNIVPNINSYGTSSVAAKIMAKYGFKDGQGLGKQEQGMSIALQVEKTSKRGGRIIHEKEFMLPPPVIPSPPPQPIQSEPSITEIMKSPSKVVLLRNMVGPGDVDEELEPEVKDECNTKYGPVVSVVIHELQDEISEEAVRIFVEFKRIESAIKAVVDLNGRFFGGRQVKAGFYSLEKFQTLQLT